MHRCVGVLALRNTQMRTVVLWHNAWQHFQHARTLQRPGVPVQSNSLYLFSAWELYSTDAMLTDTMRTDQRTSCVVIWNYR